MRTLNLPLFQRLGRLTLALTAAGALALVACGSSSSDSGSTANPAPAATSSTSATATVPGVDVTVPLVDDAKTVGAFQPVKLTIKAGQTVGWINVSGQPHNVIFDDKTVGASDLLQKGQTFKVTFAKAGTYKYTCTLHPGMDGEIDVT
ncbi:MAG: hypothetical protein NVS9B1_27340 [Candidatus Dormibacteraceae bacterium]